MTSTTFNPFEHDWVVIPWQVARYRGISAQAKVIYGRLSRYVDEKGFAYPNVTELGEEVGLGERQTRTHLQELEKEGFISVQRRFRASNLYVFLHHPCFDGEIGFPRVTPPLAKAGGAE